MSRTATIKPMQDWQRVLLEKNIGLYYKAMKRYGAGRHIDNELGNAVMFRLCSNMNMFDPDKGSISTFIFVQVKYSLFHAKRDYAFDCIKRKKITDAIRLNLENEYSLSDNGHHRSGDLSDALEKLPQRLKEVVGLHYNNKLTVKEGGAAMGLSKQRFSQLLEMAKNRIALSMSTMKGARV